MKIPERKIGVRLAMLRFSVVPDENPVGSTYMPRRTRIEIEGGLYHLITRGNDRKVVFHSSEDHDKLTCPNLRGRLFTDRRLSDMLRTVRHGAVTNSFTGGINVCRIWELRPAGKNF